MDIKLKEVLCNLKNYDFDILGSYKIDKNEAQKLIDALEDIEKCGWISCSEKMPEADKDVLATNGIGMYIGWVDAEDHKWRLDGCDCFDGSVIAWQPLPEAFESEE